MAPLSPVQTKPPSPNDTYTVQKQTTTTPYRPAPLAYNPTPPSPNATYTVVSQPSSGGGGGSQPAPAPPSPAPTPAQQVPVTKPSESSLQASGFKPYQGPSADNFAAGGYVMGTGYSPMFGETTKVYLPKTGITYELNRYGQSIGAYQQDFSTTKPQATTAPSVVWGEAKATANPLANALNQMPRTETYTTTTSPQGFMTLTGPGYGEKGLVIGVNKDVFANYQQQQRFWAGVEKTGAENKASMLFKYEQGAKYFESKTTQQFGPVAGTVVGMAFGANLPGQVIALGADTLGQVQRGNWAGAGTLAVVGGATIGANFLLKRTGIGATPVGQWIVPTGLATVGAVSSLLRGSTPAYAAGSAVGVLGTAKISQLWNAQTEKSVYYKPSEIRVTNVEQLPGKTRVSAVFEPQQGAAGVREVGGSGFLDLTSEQGKIVGHGYVSGQAIERSTTGGLFSPSEKYFRTTPSVAEIKAVSLGSQAEVTMVSEKAVVPLPALEKFGAIGKGAAPGFPYSFKGVSSVTAAPGEAGTSLFVDITQFSSKAGQVKAYSSGTIVDLTRTVSPDAAVRYLPTPTQTVGLATDGGIIVGQQMVSIQSVKQGFAGGISKLYAPQATMPSTVAVVSGPQQQQVEVIRQITVPAPYTGSIQKLGVFSGTAGGQTVSVIEKETPLTSPRIVPAILPTTRSIPSTLTLQPPITSEITKTLPATAQPPMTKTIFAPPVLPPIGPILGVPFFQLPSLPFGATPGRGSRRRGSRPRTKYVPSLGGVFSGRVTTKLPKFLTGAEVRFPFIGKRRR